MDEHFSCYLALGDSMSIDCYPAEDERFNNRTKRQDIGAASLFFRNDEQLWNEFKERDLESLFPKIYFSSYALDGATTHYLLDKSVLSQSQLDPFKSARVLVSLTIGGNDLLQALRLAASQSENLASEVAAISTRFNRVVDGLENCLGNALFLLTSVYDPSDGTGQMPGASFSQHLPIQYLHQFNESVERRAAQMKNAIFCDVHKHFLGHGLRSGEDMWYWPPSPIEPGAPGASEIRRVWLEGLEKWLAGKR